MKYKNFVLDPFQEEAIKAIDRNASVIISAPTGSGKTLVAEYAIEKAINDGRKIIYTGPIKALSNQKYRDFTKDYGEKVGILTGDVSINPYAPAIIMTTEIFRNTIFDSPERLEGVSYVIFDEIHFMDDEERGTVWEESIIFAPPHIRFICLSATVSNLHEFASWIRKIRGEELEIIEHKERQVPLKHMLYIEGRGVKGLRALRDKPEHEPERDDGDERVPEKFRGASIDYRPRTRTRPDHRWKDGLIAHLVEEKRLPCLYFVFNRKECEERAGRVKENNLVTADESSKLSAIFSELAVKYQIAGDKDTELLGKLITRGVAFHHAGMLPIHKEIVERIFTTGLIKLLFATETFAIGVNMPARTVVFDSLWKFDGRRETYMKTRDYQQMAGRAGRRGIDEVGFVYSNVDSAGMDFEIAERIMYGEVEPIQSQFNLAYSTLLNLYRKLGDRLIAACEKSFANFVLAKHPPRKRRKRMNAEQEMEIQNYYGMVAQVKRRLELLRQFGYIEGGKLTLKGEFASQIYGYEIQVTELAESGIMEGLDENWLSVLFCAIVFESKRSNWYKDFMGSDARRMHELTFPFIKRWRQRERAMGIHGLMKETDYKLSLAVKAWSEGCSFEDLGQYTSSAYGDFIRAMRLTIQLLRQVGHIKTMMPELKDKMLKAAAGLKREHVDAERQLRLG